MTQIETVLDDSKVADFIENKLVPEMTKRGRNIDGASYWITSLRNNQINCSHQWRNLATIIGGFSTVFGFNSGQWLTYCALRGNYRT